MSSSQPSARLKYKTLDVFTTTPFYGNQLAVIELPEDTPLSKDQQQAIAREFTYSESIFITSTPRSGSFGSTALKFICETFGIDEEQTVFEWSTNIVKIWTPDQELPFAGHPTVGAAFHILAAEGNTISDTKPYRITMLQVGAGNIPAMYHRGTGLVSILSPHKITLHESTSVTKVKEAILGIDEQDLGDVPVISIVDGMTFVLLRVRSVEALSRLEGAGKGRILDFVNDLGGKLEDGGSNFVGNLTYCILEDEEKGKGKVNIRSRMFFGGDSEDAATGSASCALGAYLATVAGEDLECSITQGVEMGRRSEIAVKVELNKETRVVEKVCLMGHAVQIMEGHINI